MELFPILNQSAATLSKRLVNCRGCTVCCERGGVVYLSEDEVPRLLERAVPVVRVAGIAFIKRLPDGSCPMLDRTRHECSIYEARPLCCRLFPLDAVQTKGKLRWAVSNICPDDRRRFRYVSDGARPALAIGAVARMAAALDGLVDEKIVAFVHAKEIACSKVQRLEQPVDSWTVLGKIQSAVPIGVTLPSDLSSPHSIMELGHKDKQKLKEKLKKKKRHMKKKKKKKKKKWDWDES